ncbi:MAG: VTT domain-containing protein, partial [Planctomycetota bacterium]
SAAEGLSPVSTKSRGGPPTLKILAFAAAVASAVGLYWRFGEYLDLDRLAELEGDLKTFGRENPLLLIGAAIGIYVAATGLLLPGAALLTLVYSWLFPTVFGFWPGLCIAVAVVSFSSTSGATIAFLLSRFFFGETVRHRFPKQAEAFDRRFRKDGPLYLFTLRLIAGVPFFVVNLVMGLTPIRVWTYWWVSQIGMFPGTLVYCYAGSQFPSLAELAEQGVRGILDWKLGVAFALLGVFPITVKKLFEKFGPKTAPRQPHA